MPEAYRSGCTFFYLPAYFPITAKNYQQNRKWWDLSVYSVLGNRIIPGLQENPDTYAVVNRFFTS